MNVSVLLLMGRPYRGPILGDEAVGRGAAILGPVDREGSPNSLVFFNLPASGHVNPTLPLVARLSRRGDRVLYFRRRTD